MWLSPHRDIREMGPGTLLMWGSDTLLKHSGTLYRHSRPSAGDLAHLTALDWTCTWELWSGKWAAGWAFAFLAWC